MFTSSKLQVPALLLFAFVLLALSPVVAAGAPAKATARARNGARAHGKHRLHRSKRAEQARCRSARRHGECGAGAGGTRVRDAKHLSAPHRLAAKPVKAQSPSAHETAAASIAAVLATPCQNTEVVPTAQNLAVVRAATLCLINRERAEHSESPLEANPKLEAAAEGHAQELVADDYFAHISPSGETPVDRIQQEGYVPGPSAGYVIGENLAWGTYVLATPQSIVAAWIASPGHLANILESQYTETGVAITAAVPQSLGEGNPGATYAQEFGVILH